MEKTLTPLEAWADFYQWAKTQDFWKSLSKSEKHRLYDAQADSLGSRGQGLGSARIKNLLLKYAPGRYEFRESVILKG